MAPCAAADYRIGVAGDDALTPLPISDREPAHLENLPHGLAGHASRAMALMLEDWLPVFDGTRALPPRSTTGCSASPSLTPPTCPAKAAVGSPSGSESRGRC